MIDELASTWTKVKNFFSKAGKTVKKGRSTEIYCRFFFYCKSNVAGNLVISNTYNDKSLNEEPVKQLRNVGLKYIFQ